MNNFGPLKWLMTIFSIFSVSKLLIIPGFHSQYMENSWVGERRRYIGEALMGTNVPVHHLAGGSVPFGKLNQPQIHSSNLLFILLIICSINIDAETFNFDEGIIESSSISTESGSILENDALSLSDHNYESGDRQQFGPWSNPAAPIADYSEESPDIVQKQDETWVLGAPKIPKNDLRRSFARMFISAVNLGDFEKMQEFSHTFIRPNAPFSSRLMVTPDFCIPPVLHCVGPRSHVHYMLGCYVMFPDMVLNMGQSQIVTSNHWTGSKILLPFECKMTKTYSIPSECWVPAEDTAEKLYAEPSIDRMLATLSLDESSQKSVPNEEQDLLLKKLGLSSTADHPKLKKRKRVRKSAANTPAASQYVPASYADTMRRDATMLLCPQVMHFQGLYTFSLDETHHVQRIDLTVHPLAATQTP